VLAPVEQNEDYRFGVADKVRFWVLDVDGQTVITVSDTADHFDAFVEQGQQVIESMQFG
jgi:hypothetical protein